MLRFFLPVLGKFPINVEIAGDCYSADWDKQQNGVICTNSLNDSATAAFSNEIRNHFGSSFHLHNCQTPN